MTPTEEISAKLDELGVEYDTYDLPNGEHGLSWIDGNDIEWEAVQRGENFEIHALQLVTPEQAVAATVGAGTCHKIEIYYDIIDGERDYGCSECKYMWYSSYGYNGYKNRNYKYCPNCGRRIEVRE